MGSHIFNRVSKELPCWHNAFYRRSAAFLGCILCTLALSGCTAGDFILHHSGVMSEEDYQKYIELRDTGQLDENGQYRPEENSVSPPAGSVHVTFAENSYMTIYYYLDADHKTPVNMQQCYLMPGTFIYASEPECHHPSSSWYSFDHFCVYAYDAEGNKTQALSPDEIETASPLVLQIPEDYTGSELSVFPIGKYEDRQLELSDYYIDTSGHLQELSGTWVVNDLETSGSIIEVSPVGALSVDYQYDPEKYSYVSSSPRSFYHENGLVRFDTTDASATIDSYSVELRSLGGTFLFDPSAYSAEHGTVTFKYGGKMLTEVSYIPDGKPIQYTATPDAGYNHPKSTGQIVVNAAAPDKTDAEIRDILKFYLDEQSVVILPQPSGGRIEYFANGVRLTGNRCTLPSGTIITMNFYCWNGWISAVEDGEEYTVENGEQTVSLEDVPDIYHDVFREADSHKPLLEIVLEDSVKDVKFDISAPGPVKKTNFCYADGDTSSPLPNPFGQKSRIVFSEKVGTDSPISFTARDDALMDDCALKLEIAKEDTNGNKYTSIQYIKKLPCSGKINLYEGQPVSASSIVYKTVTVTISKVEDVVSYHSQPVAHATLRTTLNDMAVPYVLKDGDILEPSRKVTITITPQTGYYISGSKDAGGIYSASMKYSDWEKDAEKLLAEHSAVKLWYVTLNTDDSYGTCTYKLDGEVVSGRVSVREGQKLTLEYTLTNPDHQIVRSELTGFVGDIIHSQTESCSIPVSQALDGTTIQRSDYITVQRKED